MVVTNVINGAENFTVKFNFMHTYQLCCQLVCRTFHLSSIFRYYCTEHRELVDGLHLVMLVLCVNFCSLVGKRYYLYKKLNEEYVACMMYVLRLMIITDFLSSPSLRSTPLKSI